MRIPDCTLVELYFNPDNSYADCIRDSNHAVMYPRIMSSNWQTLFECLGIMSFNVLIADVFVSHV